MNNNMIWLSGCVFSFVTLLWVMICYIYHRRLLVATFWGTLAAISFSLLTFSEAPKALGVGHVSDKIEKFSERLDPKIPYELVNANRVGETFVLLLREFGTEKYLYIREKTIPPEIFSLIDGKIGAIPK